MPSIGPLLPPAPPTPQNGPHDDPVKIERAAKAFESLLIGQILKSSHADGSASWLGSDDDPAGDSATELAEEQFAQALASRGGLGLAKLITKGLTTESQKKAGS
jgi:Rod binding domain-containing protein